MTSKLQYGMPSLIEAPDLDSCFRIAARLGLQFVELSMNLPIYQPGTIDIARAKALMDETGLFLTLHLSEILDPCDFNPLVADAYLNTARFAIETARELHMPVVNMHLSRGIYFTLPDTKLYLYGKYQDHYLDSMLCFRALCEDAIGASCMVVTLENTDGFMPYQKKAIDLLLESDCFQLTYDIGHNAPVITDEAFILERAPRLRHMHLHDADGNGKCHLALGDGSLPIARMLSIADKTNCRVVVETKTIQALERSVEYLRERSYM